MLLVGVVLLLTSTRNVGEAVSCPYTPLLPDYFRGLALLYHQNTRRMITRGEAGLVQPAKQMNELVWNCETEYNLNKIREQLERNTSDVKYRNFGVNFGRYTPKRCRFHTITTICGEWGIEEDYLPSNAIYGGDPAIFHIANMIKWNASEMACAFWSYNDGKSAQLICAYNVKGTVVGEEIYVVAKPGEYPCKEDAQCGANGTCTDSLCRIPISNPDTLLPIYTPTLLCTKLPLMSQFSRYYALNLHNYYRRLVASGWAENKLTRFTPRAAKMEALSYDCKLEEVAYENVKKCERPPAVFSKTSENSGSNAMLIEDTNMTKEAAIERAVREWFSQLSKHGMDLNSPWTDDPSVMNCANILHDKYNTVGCAVNICSTNGFTVVECRYGPKKLQTGSLIYNVGIPCSGCAASQKCIFGELCQS